MIKRLEISDPSSCLSKASDDELIFVLRSKDRASSRAVAAWIGERIRLGMNHPDDEKIKEAERWIAAADYQHSGI